MSYLDYNLDTFFPVNGDQTTFNIKTLLRNSIINAPYFKDLYLLKNFQEVSIYHNINKGD